MSDDGDKTQLIKIMTRIGSAVSSCNGTRDAAGRNVLCNLDRSKGKVGIGSNLPDFYNDIFICTMDAYLMGSSPEGLLGLPTSAADVKKKLDSLVTL